MAQTLAEQLENVQAAITAIENGAQSYSINDRSYNRGDLKILYAREERLQNRIAREEAAHGRTVAEF
jgi:hypothetical protein